MDVVFAKDKKERNPLLEKGKSLIAKIKKYHIPNSFYYFLILLAVGIGYYMAMLVQNDFSLAYGGDYSSQYIPMGYHIWDYYHDWFRTGHFTLFDQDVYLGVNSFGSNAYYGLFSPFNIIIVILPRVIVPQSVAITSIIKLACAGLFFSIYMKKAFKVKESISYICGLAYAFAGWGAFYLWYNNYKDVLVFFPVVLLGIEKTIQEQKPWVLATGVFFLAICNYVLMVPYLICAFLYAMFRFFQSIRKRNVADNFKVLGLGVVGFAGGLLMGMFVFAPAFLATMSSPKLDSNSYGKMLKTYLVNKDFKNLFKTLLSWENIGDQHGYVIKERVLYPIIEFFFPATTCRSLPTLYLDDWDFDDMAVSLWCYIPMIMFLVPALIQSGKEKKWSHYIAFVFMVVSLFTPVMYFLTMGFSNGYARWTLFIASSLMAYVGVYMDKIPNVSRWHMHVGYLFAIAGIIAAWILTYKIDTKTVMLISGDELVKTGRDFTRRLVEDNFDFTNIAFIIELIYTTVVYLVLFILYNKKKAFTILATVFVSIEAITMGNFVTWGHGWDGSHNNGYDLNERLRNTLTKIQKTDHSFYRMYTSVGDGWSTNNSMMNHYGSGSFFHSLYNFYVNDATLWTGLRSGKTSVGGSYRGKWQDLDNLLGVKYYIISKEKSMYDNIEKNNKNGYLANVPFDFTEKKELETSEFKVFENTNLNGFGYAYDTIYNGTLDISRTEITCVKNAIAMSKSPVVSKEDAVEITNATNHINLLIEKDEVSSIKPQYNGTHYTHRLYHMDNYSKYYDFANIPDIPNDYEATTSYDSKDAMKYFAFYTSRVANQPLYKAGTTLYIRAPFTGSRKYNFYFLDENNKIFMMDAHDDDNNDNTSYLRGFYLTRDVYKIAACGKYFESYLSDSNIRLYVESKDDYQTRMDALRANPITDVKYTADKFTFKTNFDKNKFVVSQVAYDTGWKIKAKDNTTGKVTDIKTYLGNGGFVSFVAPVGDYSYTMTYETPYLVLSYVVSCFSFVSFFISMLGYHLYQEKKRGHHLDLLFREN